jgi:hypothetical protein
MLLVADVKVLLPLAYVTLADFSHLVQAFGFPVPYTFKIFGFLCCDFEQTASQRHIVNKRQRMLKEQLKMDNPEKLATQDRKNKTKKAQHFTCLTSPHADKYKQRKQYTSCLLIYRMYYLFVLSHCCLLVVFCVNYPFP